MHNMRLFESLDKHFKSENYSNKAIREAKNNVTLEVKFEAYERYAADAPATFTQTYTGENFLDALINALDSIGIFQYIGCDYDMNADQIISNLEMSNGDGCEYIFYIKNLNSGDIIFEGDYNDVTFEDDELEEALSAEDARNASEAAEKAKEYFDKASKACDAILREETNIDIDDEPYIEEEKFLDYCELSYEKEGKNVKEKFNTVIEAKERRSELGLDEKTATIVAVYDSGEIELVEGLYMRDVAEFKKIADEIGLKTAADIERFRKEQVEAGESDLEAIKRYRAELGDDFKLREAKEPLSARLKKKLSVKAKVLKEAECMLTTNKELTETITPELINEFDEARELAADGELDCQLGYDDEFNFMQYVSDMVIEKLNEHYNANVELIPSVQAGQGRTEAYINDERKSSWDFEMECSALEEILAESDTLHEFINSVFNCYVSWIDNQSEQSDEFDDEEDDPQNVKLEEKSAEKLSDRLRKKLKKESVEEVSEAIKKETCYVGQEGCEESLEEELHKTVNDISWEPLRLFAKQIDAELAKQNIEAMVASKEGYIILIQAAEVANIDKVDDIVIKMAAKNHWVPEIDKKGPKGEVHYYRFKAQQPQMLKEENISIKSLGAKKNKNA